MYNNVVDYAFVSGYNEDESCVWAVRQYNRRHCALRT